MSELDLFQYNRWANERLLNAAARLSDEEFDRDLKSSFSSVRATLAHIAAAEWVWLNRWKGLSPAGFPTDRGDRTFDDVRSFFNENWAEQQQFLATVDEAALQRIIEYRNIAGTAFSSPLLPLMRHMINHSTYHRGQAITMIRQLGHPVPGTDLVAWYREQAIPA